MMASHQQSRVVQATVDKPKTSGEGGAIASDPHVAALSQLLRLEADVRQTPDEQSLSHLIANEDARVGAARQAFVLRRRTLRGMQVVTVSSLAIVDRTTPLIQWIERLVGNFSKTEGTARTLEFSLPAYAGAETFAASYPFQNLLWVPLWSRSNPGDDGILLARETPWLEPDRRIAERVAETYGHALLLHRSRPPRLQFRLPVRLVSLIAATALIAAGFIPVPMTALAPLEVMARDPQTVTMPQDGIIQQILVEPNTVVNAGQPLVQLVDTIARNKLALAERETLVAAAKLEKASSLSFTDARGRHELGIARAELELRQAERDFARSLLDKTVLSASKAGVAVFPSRKELEGKPLAVGEKIMLIVTPSAVELKIDLAVADSVVLQTGARAKHSWTLIRCDRIEASVSRIDYQARLSDTGVAAYRVIASVEADERQPPQLGVRGTAQLYGPDTPIAVFLLRRPLSAIRQWVGL